MSAPGPPVRILALRPVISVSLPAAPFSVETKSFDVMMLSSRFPVTDCAPLRINVTSCGPIGSVYVGAIVAMRSLSAGVAGEPDVVNVAYWTPEG